MGKPGYFSGIRRFLKTALLADLGIFIAAGLICWFGGWLTVHLYGHSLMWAGLAAILLGLLSVPGSYETWSFAYQYALSARAKNIDDYTRQRSKDASQSQAFFLRMVVIGVVPTILGTLLQTVSM